MTSRNSRWWWESVWLIFLCAGFGAVIGAYLGMWIIQRDVDHLWPFSPDRVEVAQPQTIDMGTYYMGEVGVKWDTVQAYHAQREGEMR